MEDCLEESRREEADTMASIAKFHATNTAFDTSNRAVRIFGASRYRKTTRVARHFLDSRATTIYEGTNEVLKSKIAAMMLGRNYTSL
jgi:alkylation response protein AidB-like acyl-CoA dehydrogenase